MLKKQITLLIIIALIVGLFGMAQLCYDGSGGGSITLVSPADDDGGGGDDDDDDDDGSSAACAIPTECLAAADGLSYQIAGTMNEWPTSGSDGLMSELSDCNGLYQVAYELTAGDYTFKFKTLGNWNDSTSIGGTDYGTEVNVVGNTADGLVYDDISGDFLQTGRGNEGGGNDLSITISEDDTYVFCANVVAEDDIKVWAQKGAEGVTDSVTVASVDPADGDTEVNWRSSVAVTFSTAMDTSTTESAFTLVDSSGASMLDSGTLSWSDDSDVLTFALNDGVYYELAETYTVGVSTDAAGSDGTALSEAFESSFTVITEEPLAYDFDSCNDPLDAADGTSYEMIGEMNDWGGGDNAFIEDSDCNGKFKSVYEFTAGSYNFKFRKSGEWDNDTTIGAVAADTVEIFSDGTFSSTETYRGFGDGGQNMTMTISNDGNHEVNFQIANTTETVSYSDSDVEINPVSIGVRETDEDVTTVDPTVSSSSPADGDTDSVTTGTVTVTFNVAMDEDATESAFTLTEDGAGEVAGSVSWDDDSKVLTFTPDSELSANTDFTITVTTSATDADGNALDEEYSATFTTGDASAAFAYFDTCPSGTVSKAGIDFHIVGDGDDFDGGDGASDSWNAQAIGAVDTFTASCSDAKWSLTVTAATKLDEGSVKIKQAVSGVDNWNDNVIGYDPDGGLSITPDENEYELEYTVDNTVGGAQGAFKITFGTADDYDIVFYISTDSTTAAGVANIGIRATP